MAEQTNHELSGDVVGQEQSDNVDSAQEVKKDTPGIFIGENDTFDIEIKYYRDGKSIVVYGVDDNFDESNKETQTITMTLKYPSHGDFLTINNIKSNVLMNRSDDIDIKTFLQVEYYRLTILLRKWSLSDSVEEESILRLHPKIVKGAFHKIRENIGLDGII